MNASVINSRMNGESSHVFHDGFLEGSSARTRPYSCDEILIRRQRKKLLKKKSEEISQDLAGHSFAGKLFDLAVSKQDKGCNKDSCSNIYDHHHPVRLKHKKMGSRIGKDPEHDDCLVGGFNNEVHRHSESTLMTVKTDRNLRSFVRSSIVRIHGDGTDEVRSSTAKTRSRKLVDECDANGRRRSSSRKRRRRTSELTDKKTKPSEVDEKGRERNDTKKRYLGRWHDLEFARGKERANSHREKARLRRRRSRSEDADFRVESVSASPRAVRRAFRRGSDRTGALVGSRQPRAGLHGNYVKQNRATGTDSRGLSKRRRDGSRSGLDEHQPQNGNNDDADNVAFPARLPAERRNAKWDLAPERTAFSAPCAGASSSTGNAASTAVPVVSSVSQPNVALAGDRIVGSDSVELRQATRSTRRLLVENVPSTVSEESLVEWFNNFLISAGGSRVEGILPPCISCVMFKEKDQAMVEFLTPEDASAALSFDGCMIADSTAKIRRPKDFADIATGELEKSAAVINDAPPALVNKNTPHKVFVCGLSDLVTSEMFREIACVFGQLKTCHFEDKKDLNQTFAFLEYAEEAMAFRACAGLNGMKIGGQVITAVQVDPDVSLGDGENPQFSSIPVSTKPFLQAPTQILKLKNMFDVQMLYALTDAGIEEVVEDVRLECKRFGMVKSINVVKGKETAALAASSSSLEANDNVTSGEIWQSVLPKESTPSKETPAMGDVPYSMEDGSSQIVACLNDDDDGDGGDDDDYVFEAGCVFVEFQRREASCIAAHSLHGRSYEDRVVAAEFVPLAAYRTRFHD